MDGWDLHVGFKYFSILHRYFNIKKIVAHMKAVNFASFEPLTYIIMDGERLTLPRGVEVGGVVKDNKCSNRQDP